MRKERFSCFIKRQTERSRLKLSSRFLIWFEKRPRFRRRKEERKKDKLLISGGRER